MLDKELFQSLSKQYNALADKVEEAMTTNIVCYFEKDPFPLGSLRPDWKDIISQQSRDEVAAMNDWCKSLEFEMCIFCFGYKSNNAQCPYGTHEYPKRPVKQERKKDTQLCLKCGMHPRNPKYQANECEHEHSG